MNILYIMGIKYTINGYFRECLCNGIKTFKSKRKRLIYIEKFLYGLPIYGSDFLTVVPIIRYTNIYFIYCS